MAHLSEEFLGTEAGSRLCERPQYAYCDDGRKIRVTHWETTLSQGDVARVSMRGQVLDWRGAVVQGMGLFDGAMLVCPRDLRTDTGLVLEIVTWTVRQTLEDVTITMHGFPCLETPYYCDDAQAWRFPGALPQQEEDKRMTKAVRIRCARELFLSLLHLPESLSLRVRNSSDPFHPFDIEFVLEGEALPEDFLVQEGGAVPPGIITWRTTEDPTRPYQRVELECIRRTDG